MGIPNPGWRRLPAVSCDHTRTAGRCLATQQPGFCVTRVERVDFRGRRIRPFNKRLWGWKLTSADDWRECGDSDSRRFACAGQLARAAWWCHSFAACRASERSTFANLHRQIARQSARPSHRTFADQRYVDASRLAEHTRIAGFTSRPSHQATKIPKRSDRRKRLPNAVTMAAQPSTVLGHPAGLVAAVVARDRKRAGCSRPARARWALTIAASTTGRMIRLFPGCAAIVVVL